jgi:arylsulfatase A-like enzyme
MPASISPKKRLYISLPLLALLGFAPLVAAERPNVVIILADDVGYGDLGCYGATAVSTPNLDRLAREGLRFTDAHAPSSVCTPSRYALLTGQYGWRNRAAAGILSGISPLCIATDQLTLPRLFQNAGYATGAVGKWHLGLGAGRLDYNRPLSPGPLEIGFDSFFGFPATGDRTPCVYIENRQVVGWDASDPIRVSYDAPLSAEPTGRDHPELLKIKPSHGHDQTIINGISRIGYMSGGRTARWVDEQMADILTAKAVRFVEQHRAEPFFLYFATHDIHVPRVPNARFAGKSPHGTRGDVISQLDWSVGELLTALDRRGLAGQTLVIFTSDNGGVMDDGYQDGSQHDASGHRCNGPWRGYKGSLFEGGHRVPFLARWPGHIAPGVSNQLICHVDLLATLAALVDQPLPGETAGDSFDALPALLDQHAPPVRDHLVHHSGGFPGALAIRQGAWKLLESGRPGYAAGADAMPLLFNLHDDPAETRDLSAQQPGKVRELTALLGRLRTRRSSRPVDLPAQR